MSPIMPTVRTALIGCGKVGQIHAAALHALPESELVAVCDSEPQRADGVLTLRTARVARC